MDGIMEWFSLDAETILVVLVVVLALCLYQTTRLPRDFPPGPRPLPIVGNLISIAKHPKRLHKYLAELAKQYGPVVGMKLGSHPTIILCNYDVIKEAIVKKADAFSHRPEFLHIYTKVTIRGGARRGLAWTDGEPWKETRRFSLMALRDFGLGKKSIEERIQEEGAVMCAEMLKASRKPFEITTLSQQAVSNIICSICFGSRFEYTDPAFTKMMDLITYNFATDLFTRAGNFFPWMKYLPFQDIQQILDNVQACLDWIDELIRQHRETFDPDNIRDFVDLYIQKEREGQSEDSFLSADSMHRIIFDLFGAGTETTSTALRWLVLFMIRHPEIQNRCQDEIDNAIGAGRQPSLSDRSKVPYVDATIRETLRFGNIAALAIPHKTEKETSVAGYRIPRNTLVFLNTYAVHMDPNYWEEPEKFNPDRWLGPDGKVEKNEAFMPFSVGPRYCVGQTLAESELFIFFVMLLQQFNLKLVDPSQPPSMEGNMGITLVPQKYSFIAEPRI